MQQDQATIYRVAGVRDALGVDARPGVVVVRQGQIVAAGGADQESGYGGSRIVDCPHMLILPVFVNAHAHLDLTAVGPRPYNGRFVDWLKTAIQTGPSTQAQATQAIEIGIQQSKHAGVGYVGDISRWESIQTRFQSVSLPGVSYLECFGIGQQQSQAVTQLKQRLAGISDSGVRDPTMGVAFGLQPHAPYSAGLELYLAAAELAGQHGYRLSTHLAETHEELVFIRDAKGPFVELLKHLGKWDGSIRATGLHPVAWLEPALRAGRWLLAHCHYVDDRQIEMLARCGASVAYCPIASDYFGHHQPQRKVYHRYRDMLSAGINVCLGTDSILCQRPSDPQPLGIGSQMRYLYRRDRTDPITLLRMATVNGLHAMGLPPSWASLQPGSPGRWVMTRVDPQDPTDLLVQALCHDGPMMMYSAQMQERA